jgi:hypothetical protein
MADEIENEFMKRGYLLPKGCKDLIDLWKPKAEPASFTLQPRPLPRLPEPQPPIIGEMIVPSRMTVGELAVALSQKPFRIVADLIEIGVFATLHHVIGFDAISRVMRKHGFTAKRAI